MKYILVLLVLFSFSYSDEIQRIESIVKDITNLREKYQDSQNQLIIKEKNQEKQSRKILDLENQIKKYKKQLEVKEKYINKLNVKKPKKKVRPKKQKEITMCKPQNLKTQISFQN